MQTVVFCCRYFLNTEVRMPSSVRRLLIASAKGGVGKSTTAVGIAAEMARMEKKTLLCDLDMTSRSLDMLTGEEDRALFGFSDVIHGKPLDDAVITDVCGIRGLNLLPSTVTESDADFDERLKNTVRDIVSREDYDFVVVDTGGGISVAEKIAPFFDSVIVTSEQSQTSLRAAEFAGAELQNSGGRNIRLVVCAFDLPSVKREKRAGIVEMIDRSSLKCVGVVPLDKKLQKLQDSGKIPERTESALAYKNIARRLEGYDVPLFYGMRGMRKKLSSAL